MRIRNSVIPLLSILVWTACSSPHTSTSVIFLTPSYTPASEMTSVISQATPELTATQSAESVLKQECRDILPNFPTGETPQGSLVLLSPNGLSILNINERTQREISGLLDSVGISPDRKFLSYSPVGSNKLIVESTDGKIQTQTNLKQGWLTFDQGFWLDNEQLWFSVFPNIANGEVASVAIVNPFNGKQQEIPSDYPGIKRYQFDFSNSPGLHFGYSSVVYDPSLNLAIYPQEADDGWYIALWDRQSQKVITKLADGGLYGHLPLWLPDGSGFAVVARSDWNSPREWFIVSRDGEFRQLTHFQDLYSQFEISSYASVSPNGKYIAFGLSPDVDANSDKPKRLIILNLQTSEAIDTCITFSFPEPIWSPDSQYLAALSRNLDNKSSSTVVLDIEQKWAVKIDENPKAKPMGWMLESK